MKAITVRQPWAWLLLNGADIYNLRGRHDHRGELAIHAGMGMNDGDYLAGYAYASERGVILPSAEELKLGQILGLVDVVACVDISDSKWFDGPYGFILANPRGLGLRTVHTRGNSGIWKVDSLLEKLIRGEL